DQPVAAVAAHHVVDLDRPPIGFDDLAAHHHPGWRGLLTSYLQPLSVIAVEAIGINRRDVASEALDNLLAPLLAETGPGRGDCQPCHGGNVKPAADARRQLREAPALAQCPAVL